jgi:hypothetical protein
VSDWPAGEHLASIYDALYLTLGEGAPRVTSDECVVRLHETSRSFGELVRELRGDEDVVPDAVVAAVITDAAAADESGLLMLYAWAMVLGPRLLVTLRDYLVHESDVARREVVGRGGDRVVSEIWAASRTLARLAPRDDTPWARTARALAEGLDRAGMAESLGQRH